MFSTWYGRKREVRMCTPESIQRLLPPLPPPPSAGVERRLDSAASTTTIYGRESNVLCENFDESPKTGFRVF